MPSLPITSSLPITCYHCPSSATIASAILTIFCPLQSPCMLASANYTYPSMTPTHTPIASAILITTINIPIHQLHQDFFTFAHVAILFYHCLSIPDYPSISLTHDPITSDILQTSNVTIASVIPTTYCPWQSQTSITSAIMTFNPPPTDSPIALALQFIGHHQTSSLSLASALPLHFCSWQSQQSIAWAISSLHQPYLPVTRKFQLTIIDDSWQSWLSIALTILTIHWCHLPFVRLLFALPVEEFH